MTNLSKQLGEIKRRQKLRDWGAKNKPFSTLANFDKQAAYARAVVLSDDDAKRLLHIIEVEIPGMLRARCTSLSAFINPAVPENMHILQYAIDELNAYSTLIESLTKDNEKENG